MLYVVGNTKKKIVVRNSVTGEEKAYSLKKLKKKKENIYGVYHGKKNEVTGFTTLSFMTLPKLEKINENIIYGIMFKKRFGKDITMPVDMLATMFANIKQGAKLYFDNGEAFKKKDINRWYSNLDNTKLTSRELAETVIEREYTATCIEWIDQGER